MSEDIVQLERDIKNWDKIKKVLTIYLVEIAIPDYAKRASRIYKGTMSGVVNGESENAASKVRCWQALEGQFDNDDKTVMGFANHE